MALRKKNTGILTTSQTQTNTSYNSGSTPSTTVSSSSFVAASEQQYMSGVDIPNFRERVARGDLLPHTSFYQSFWKGDWVTGSFYSEEIQWGGEVYTSISSWKGVSITGTVWRVLDHANYDCEKPGSPDTSDVHHLMQTSASKIYGKGFDALTAAAEASQVIPLYKQVVKDLLTTIKVLRKQGLTPSQIRSLKKQLGDLYLSYRYGVRPLAHDLSDLYGALTEFDATREIWSERSGYSYSESSTDQIVSQTKIGNLVYDLSCVSEYRYSIRGSVTGRLSPSRIQADPVQTLWELVPLSFVFDWVLDVGDYLGYVAFRVFSSEYSSSYGTRTDYTKRYILTGGDSNTHLGSADCEYVYTGTIETRTPSSISNLPQPPRYEADPFKILDLQAILRSSLR